MRVRGSELVVRALLDEGVEKTFGIPGTHNIELYDAIERAPGLEAVLVTSEVAAAFMADGYARTSGRPGVLNLVPGAGVTHAMSGIAEAWMDNVPLVVFACGIRNDTGAAFQLHAVDQIEMLRPVTKAALRVRSADEIYPAVRRAFAAAREGCPGPAAVEVAANLMMLTQHVSEPSWDPVPEAPPQPAPALLDEAAKRLAAAARPAIYAGAGASGASDLLVELAERLAAPVTTTISGKGVFPESHPLWLWNGFGRMAPGFVQDVMDDCDCLLAIGCRFSEVATGSYGLSPPDNLIHVDADPEVFHRNYPAAVAVGADARVFTASLIERLTLERPRREIEAAIARGHAEVQAEWRKHSSEDRVTPWRMFDALQRHARPDAVYATDSGNGTFLAMEHLRLEAPGRFIGPVDFSCMGYSTPAAIGAAFASPGRDVVALAGDGALLMTGLELLTAASYGAAPVVVVLRDGKLGQIAQFQKLPMNRETCSVLPDYDCRALAQAVGSAFYRVVADHELDGVLESAFDSARRGLPAMVEVAIDYSRKTYFTKGVVKTNFLRFSWGDRMRTLGRALGRRLVG
jgi:acetolactate synthase-1/2/3 large subunit